VKTHEETGLPQAPGEASRQNTPDFITHGIHCANILLNSATPDEAFTKENCLFMARVVLAMEAASHE
jgi:hypothetical protein